MDSTKEEHNSLKSEGVLNMLTRKIGNLIAKLIAVALVGLIGFGEFSLFKAKAANDKEPAGPAEDHDMVFEDDGPLGYTAADFGPVVLGKATELSKYEVYNRELSQKETLTDTAILNIKYLTKKQSIKFSGDSTWTVNMEDLKESDISVDNDKKVVSIVIPLPEVNIKLNPAKTQNGKVVKGSKLAFGKIKIEPEAYKALENRALKDMYSKVIEENEIHDAQTAAVKAMKTLYNPVIRSVAEDYTVNITFKAPNE